MGFGLGLGLPSCRMIEFERLGHQLGLKRFHMMEFGLELELELGPMSRTIEFERQELELEPTNRIHRNLVRILIEHRKPQCVGEHKSKALGSKEL